MSSMTVDQDNEDIRVVFEKQKAEMAAHQAEVRSLQAEYGRTPAMLQMLGKLFGFGTANELEWAQFKLTMTEREFDRCQSQYVLMTAAVAAAAAAAAAKPANAVRETTREKMGRMIRENPSALAQHILKVYQPLIESEESVEKAH